MTMQQTKRLRQAVRVGTGHMSEMLEPRRLLATVYDVLPAGAVFSEAEPNLPAGAVYVDSVDNLDGEYSAGAVWAMEKMGYDLSNDPRANGVIRDGATNIGTSGSDLDLATAPTAVRGAPGGGETPTDAPVGSGQSGTRDPISLGQGGRQIDAIDRSSAGFIPPDTMGSVGNDHVVEIINGGFRVWDKNGNQLDSRSLDSFWINKVGVTPLNFSFDPRIQYDVAAQKWYAVAVDNSRNDNRILIARSDSADPTGDWDGFAIDSDGGTGNRWADFPQLGFDNDGVYVTANMFDIDGGASLSTEVNIFIFPKADLNNASISVANRTRIEDVIGTTGFAAQPVVYKDASEGVSAFPPAFVSADSNSINFSGLGGTINSPAIANFSDVSVSNRGSPPLADQPGLTGDLESGGNRIRSQVVEQNGLYFGVNGIDISSQAGIRFFKITTGNVLEQDRGIFLTSEEDAIYPSIDANNAGDIVIGFTVTSSSRFPSTAFLASVNPGAGNDHQFPSFGISQNGNDTYQADDSSGRNRWGDYSATVVDPQGDDSYFWTFQEYAKGVNSTGFTGTWGTHVQEVSPQGVVTGRLPRTLTSAEGYIVPFGPTGSSPDVQDGDAFINFDGDIDSYFLNSDNSLRGNGVVTITANDAGSVDIDTVLALYDADTGFLEALNDNFSGDDSQITFTLPSTGSRFIVAVTNKLYDPTSASFTGDVPLTVTWNNQFDGAALGLDGNGDHSQNVFLNPTEDTDFYRVTSPANATGSVTFTLDPDTTLDGELWIFDAAGNVLGSGEATGTNVNETVTLSGISPGQELFITVQSNNFATTGIAVLTTNFVTQTAPASPTVPNLASGFDSGISSADNITNVNDNLQFAIFAAPGQFVRLFRNGVLVAGPVLVNGTTGGTSLSDTTGPLADGTYNYTATAAFSNTGSQSPASGGLAVTIDTLGPTQSNFSFSFNQPQDHRFFVDFTEQLSGFTASDIVVRNTTTGLIIPSVNFNLSSSGSFNDLVYNPTANVDLLPNGDYDVRIAAGAATDRAGNGISAFSGTDFFLAGDVTRDRVVNLFDLFRVRSNIGTSTPLFTNGDADYNGIVNLIDFFYVRSRIGSSI